MGWLYMEVKEELEEVKKETKEKVEVTDEKEASDSKRITVKRLLEYFIIYSIVGFVIETLFALATKGVIESRKSALYGPFCCIYGVGVAFMIPCLSKCKKNNFTLFLGGFILGSVTEYAISLFGELIYDVKWWDYSGMAFNINGRTCLAFSFFWGILAIFIMTYFNPKVDKLLDKIPKKYSNALIIIFLTFIIMDTLISGFALKIFFTRLVKNYDLKLKDADAYIISETEFLENKSVKWLSNNVFTDERILKAFPNLRVSGENDEIIYIENVLKDIQPYYFRVFQPKY